MKIIFLDIDGVVNPWDNVMSGSNRDDHGILFETSCINILDRIVKVTGAKIVVSSTWRVRGLEQILQMWADRNLPGEVIGITPVYDFYGEFESESDGTRGYEIQTWLEESNLIITEYLIIDDIKDFYDYQLPNFLHTDGNIGLQESDYQLGIDILNSLY